MLRFYVLLSVALVIIPLPIYFSTHHDLTAVNNQINFGELLFIIIITTIMLRDWIAYITVHTNIDYIIQ